MRHVYIRCFLLLFISTLFNFCNHKKPTIVFSESRENGIAFVNQIIENQEVNPFVYDNVYSGGGVAVGDVNNDGLPDIYFGGNQVSDALYINKGNLVFEEISHSAGILDKGGWTTGVAIVDVNNDGLNDIYVCKSLYDNSPELRVNELYINEGGLRFREAASQFGLDDPWRSQQAVFFDFDKDKDLDVFLVNQPPNPGVLSGLKGQDWRLPFLSWRLLENQAGSFREVTDKAGLNHVGYGLSAIAGDFNNDSWPDLYVTSDYNNPDYLYINQKDGSFRNMIHESMGHISFFSMGVDASDINNDGLLDLMVVDMVPEDNFGLKANMSGMNPTSFWRTVEEGGHYQYMMNTLQLNRGGYGFPFFSEISQLAGVAYTDWSWTPMFADYNNDGYKDLFISNGILRELRNTDAIKRVNNIIREGIDKGFSKKDILNHNLTYLLSQYPQRKPANYLYQNVDGYQFENVGLDWGGVDSLITTSVAAADLDLDGDIDLVLNNVNDTASIYENHSAESMNFVGVKLFSHDGNTIGAKLKVEYLDEFGSSKVQFSEVTNTRGFYSAVNAYSHFGIAKAQKILKITVTWPSGIVSILKDAGINQIHEIKEESARLATMNSSSSYLFSVESLSAFHVENKFDDFSREVLLPHKLSNLGPKSDVMKSFNGSENVVYMPGATGHSGYLYSVNDRKVMKNESFSDLSREEVNAVFFDVDNDSDEDLYVVIGGNEEVDASKLQDLLYLNDGNEFHLQEESLPRFEASTFAVKPCDYDKDGDMDLFVGGRLIPGSYPRSPGSRILKNTFEETGQIKFVDVTKLIAAPLLEVGMISDAVWSDFDGDQDEDLVIVGEWTSLMVLQNDDGTFVHMGEELGLSNYTGWWFHINATDFDNDGDDDFLIGNLGLNYKYKADREAPFSLYSDDFDDNGVLDIVLGYFNAGAEYPVRGRSCSSQQIPELKRKFSTYDEFASKKITDIYGKQELESAATLRVNTFHTVLVENMVDTMIVRLLPIQVQFSPLRTSVTFDFNKDGLADILYAGNFLDAEVETPRADAGLGGVLINKGGLNFEYLDTGVTGLFLDGDVRDMNLLQMGEADHFVVLENSDSMRLLKVNNQFLFSDNSK